MIGEQKRSKARELRDCVKLFFKNMMEKCMYSTVDVKILTLDTVFSTAVDQFECRAHMPPIFVSSTRRRTISMISDFSPEESIDPRKNEVNQ